MHGLEMLIRVFAVLTSIRGHIPQSDRFEPFRDDSAAGGGFGGPLRTVVGLVVATAAFAAALTGAVLLAARWPN
ncbi:MULTISPECIES: hypothetical protein [unclassified Bradyrhizobium]|uniref:hypothetical protein n=1 Tax=unclassified Bradyrhizobium TaxID=2631580 RepID=UPI0028E832DF|nr:MULTISPECIES: hypothetical protein [unclassified Bradyrhizobium]